MSLVTYEMKMSRDFLFELYKNAMMPLPPIKNFMFVTSGAYICTGAFHCKFVASINNMVVADGAANSTAVPVYAPVKVPCQSEYMSETAWKLCKVF